MGVIHGGGVRIPPELAVGGRLYRLSPQILVVFQNFKRSPWIRLPPDFNPDLRHWVSPIYTFVAVNRLEHRRYFLTLNVDTFSFEFA
jgi:hypothetical protein